jgi:hypothetical protein
MFAYSKRSFGGFDEMHYTRVAGDGRVGALAFAAEADAARKAATSEDSNPGKSIPIDPAHSQAIERAAAEQKRILDAGASEEEAREKTRAEKLRAAGRDARTRDKDDDHSQEL